MQTTGYIRINDEILKILVRFETDKTFHRTGYFARFKLRKSGQIGTHFTAEEKHLIENPDLIQQLKLGETIRV